jgi:hypothetical protein
MGMFDEIICEYPLENAPSFIEEGHKFQTKSLDNTMSVYKISKDGKLILVKEICGSEVNKDLKFHGEIIFYTSNIKGCGHGIYFTRDGAAAENVDYKAIFNQGQLTEIKLINKTIEDALPVSEQNFKYLEDVESEEMPESFLNSTVFVLWGGMDFKNGYNGKFIAESDKEIVIQTDKKFEILYKSSFNYTVFLNQEHAKRVRTSNEIVHQKETERLNALIEKSKK